MPWCPKCKIEYREGFSRCSECGSKLVDEFPEKEKNEPWTKEVVDTEAFLITAEGCIQADILESKLRFYGIPVMRKYRESGGYLKIYMGATPFGVDLYVPSKMLAIAKKLLENDTDPIETERNTQNDNT